MTVHARPLFIALAAAAGLFMAPAPAVAWGVTGHKAVCALAYRLIDDSTRRAVDALIANDPDFASFEESCSWADTPRKRSREHYVNVPRATSPGEVEDCGEVDKCILSAIDGDLAILSAPDASPDARLAALKFLGHWVGDVHQPFHVSFASDRGANDVAVRGRCRGALHGAWDGCLVERAFGRDGAAIAERMIADGAAPPADAGSPADWANESYALVIDPSTRYCTRTVEGCAWSRDHLENDASAPPRTEQIDDAYIARHSGAILERLRLAGERLASLLNGALGGAD